MGKRQLLQAIVLMAVFALSVVEPIAAQEQTTTTPVASAASVDAVEKINQEMEALAVELMSSLPPTGTYAVKNANDSSSGVPEDLLAQMTSSLQTSLMVASNFSITLIDQAQLQESWANAVEFNGADFETMVGQANFDALIVLNTRATVAGLEVSLQAVGATSIDAGQILASTKLRSVNVDWNDFKSVDYSEKMSDKVSEIQKQLEALKSQSEPVLKPVTFADHYHNAIIYKKNNENQKEIESLESALRIEPKFYDVLSDLIQVLVKVYGKEVASKFVEARLANFLPPEMTEYSKIMVEFEGSEDFPVIIQASLKKMMDSNMDELSPLAAQWIKSSESTFVQSLRNGQRNLDQYADGEPGMAKDLYNFLSAVRIVIRSYDSGEFQKQFLDTNRSYAAAEIEKMRDYELEFNQVEYGNFSTMFDQGSGLIYHFNKWEYDSQGRPISSELLEMNEPNTLNITKIEIDGYYTHCIFKTTGPVPRLKLEDPRVEVKFPLHFTDPSAATFSAGDFWPTFPGLPIDVSTDRIIFGDACKDATKDYVYDKGVVRGLHRLLITDDVDVSKPIVLELSLEDSEEGMATYKVDISEDGTYFLQGGAPINSTNFDGFDVFPSESNAWLFAPGIVQSALFSGGLVSVSYTDIYGAEKTIDGERSNLPNIRSINVGSDDNGNPVRGGSVIGGNHSFLTSNSVSRVGSPNASDVAIVEDEVSNNSNDSSVVGNQSEDDIETRAQERAIADAATAVDVISRSLTSDDRTAVQNILKSKGLYAGSNDGKWGNGTRASFELLFTALQLGGVQYNIETPDNFVSMIIMVKGFDASYFSTVIAKQEKDFGILCYGDNLNNNCFAIRLFESSQVESMNVAFGFWNNDALNGNGVVFFEGKAWSGQFENHQLNGDGRVSWQKDENGDGELEVYEVIEGKFVDGNLAQAYETPFALDITGIAYAPEIESANTDLPSFDCNQQLSITESTICANRGVSQAEQTSTNYFNALKRKLGPDVAKLVAEFFLERRDACGSDPHCISRVLGQSAAVFHDLNL